MNDISIIDIEDVTVGIAPVMADAPSRREAERAAVARLVEALLGKGVTVLHREDGAPYIADGPYISVTHCRDIAAIAVCPTRQAGIDAEQWRAALRRVTSKFLSAAESATFTSDSDLLRAWTVKEAVFKVAGGAALDFKNNIDISHDFSTATALGRTFRLHTFAAGDATVTVAMISHLVVSG